MHAYLFPGQGTQFPRMGLDLYKSSPLARDYFHYANELLGYSITEIMFNGSSEQLKQTIFAQPAIFLYSFIKSKLQAFDFPPNMVAGHSLGEISALTFSSSLDFESAIKLIKTRASAMQRVCNVKNTSMVVVVGLCDLIVQNICNQEDGIVVPANYNAPGQVVISGEVDAMKRVVNKLKFGADKILRLDVNGAFHSPFMKSAVLDYTKAIERTNFSKPLCPIYQNVTGHPTDDISEIKRNLIDQLTQPVMWRQTINNMIGDGATCFEEIGPGNFLSSLVHQIAEKKKIIGLPMELAILS